MTFAPALETEFPGVQPSAPRPKPPLRCVLMDRSGAGRTLVRSLGNASRYDLEFVETDSIAETRTALAERSADLLVLDSTAPDGCAITFAEELSRGLRHHATPVILIAGDTTKQAAIQAMRSGAADFLAKDEMTLERFDAAVESALRRSSVLPADQTARMSNLEAENETLRRITLRNMRLLKAQAMPLIAFAWRRAADGAGEDVLPQKLERLTRNLTALIDDTVITAATHRANEIPQPVDLAVLIAGIAEDEDSGLIGARTHLRVGALPILLARPSQMEMLFKELMLTAVRSCRLGTVPEIEIGASVDPEDNPVIWMREHGLSLSARKQNLGQRFQELAEPPTDLGKDENSWSLCQRLVEKNQGRFRITHEDQSSSRILMWFPRDMLVSDAVPGGSEIA